MRFNYFLTKYFLATCILLFAIGIPLQAVESSLTVDNQTGVILQSTRQNRKLPIGSTAQLATAMVTLDWARLSNQSLSTLTKIPPLATASHSSPLGLQAGDSISLRDLLYCVILASDDVAAIALADHIGSRVPNSKGLVGKDSFVSQMNALSRQLGMSRTLFLSPDGADQKGGKQSYSTAADIARLVRYAYARPEFPFYADQISRIITINRTGQEITFRIQNTNTLLGNQGTEGAKIGYSPRVGQCLALTASRPSESYRQDNRVTIIPRRIIIVLLGATNSFSEGTELLRQGWALYDEWAASGRPIQERNFL